MKGKSDVKRSSGEAAGTRWIPPRIAMRITGHSTPDTLRKAAKQRKKFGWRKHPGTGLYEYDLRECLAYADKTEADIQDLLPLLTEG
jgi:hypothetical protein